MPDDDQGVVMALLDGMIMNCQAKRMAGNLSIPELRQLLKPTRHRAYKPV